jgi:hypothetical protein
MVVSERNAVTWRAVVFGVAATAAGCWAAAAAGGWGQGLRTMGGVLGWFLSGSSGLVLSEEGEERQFRSVLSAGCWGGVVRMFGRQDRAFTIIKRQDEDPDFWPLRRGKRNN